jgi:hypothetical protein
MYLVYADESGDPGLNTGGTPFFVISGIIIHESHWNQIFQDVVNLRRQWHALYNTPQRIALHATDIVNGHRDFHHSRSGLSSDDRFSIYREALQFLASQKGKISVLNVFIRKDKILRRDLDVYEWSWKFFIQRFHNSIDTGGALHEDKNYGILMTDRTQDDKLRALLRKMRRFNPVPTKIPGMPAYSNVVTTRIIDDPVPRNSNHSYFVQMADLVAFALARRDYPRKNLEQWAFESYFEELEPIVLKAANPKDTFGVYYWPL